VARDSDHEEANRQLVVSFYDGVFNKHDVDRASQVLADDYKQHNPQLGDGKAAFVQYFAEFFVRNPAAHSRIVRSASDGDLVFLHVHSTAHLTDRGDAVVDIFRVDNGKIVEHWDVIQSVPAESTNTNTMF
jgi:predicted SnoaL-like aldol condensation-catalyzing enzyme